MARPRSRGFPASRRKSTWVGPADQNYVSVASGGATLMASFDVSQSANSAAIGSTVVRSRGQVSIIPQSVTTDLVIAGAFGLGIVSSQALAVGITAVPEPFDEADWDGWFVWRSFTYKLDVVSATGILPFIWDFEVDSKAMRKLGEGDAIIFVAQSQSGAYDIAAPLRLLLKLA